MPLENIDKHINQRLMNLEVEIRSATGKTTYLSVGCYSEERKRYVLEDRTKDVNVPIGLTPYLTHGEILIALDTAIQMFRRVRTLYS